MFDNLNYYRVFYTVANTGNISKAADMLFISQPAISKAISKLEDGLHVKLFLRSSKGVTLCHTTSPNYSHNYKLSTIAINTCSNVISQTCTEKLANRLFLYR